MKVTPEKNEKLANMIFAEIYPLSFARLEKNGRTKEEFHQVLEWFTGLDEAAFKRLIDDNASYRNLFEHAKIHPNSYLIKGVVCGFRIEEIEEEFDIYKKARQMEKLIDELAKGRKMEKKLRVEKKQNNHKNRNSCDYIY
jgi:hypothetical protein